MADIRIAMLGTNIGETIDVKVVRTKSGENREHLFKVELTVPPAQQPHP
jgi:hypothetical protein